jgi:DNA-directed RNA polymerase subunit RPC12/RpoP
MDYTLIKGTFKCHRCGNIFKSTKVSKYCGDICRYPNGKNTKKPPAIFICKKCGNNFEAVKSSKSKTCNECVFKEENKIKILLEKSKMDKINIDLLLDNLFCEKLYNIKPENIDKALIALENNKEEYVIRKRFGNNRITLREIGIYLGLSTDRIKQIQDKALRRLRHPLRRRIIIQS